MTRIYVLAKVMFVVLGLYALQQILNSLCYLPFGVYQNIGAASPTSTILITIPFFAFACIVTYYLLFKSDKWCHRLTEPINEDTRPADTIWITACFRLTTFCCGLVILAGLIEIIVKGLGFILFGPKLIVNSIVHGEFHETFPQFHQYVLD